MIYLLAHIVLDIDMGNSWIDFFGGMVGFMVILGLLHATGVIGL